MKLSTIFKIAIYTLHLVIISIFVCLYYYIDDESLRFWVAFGCGYYGRIFMVWHQRLEFTDSTND